MFRAHSKSLQSQHNAEEFEILELKLIFLLLVSVHEGKKSMKKEWNVCGNNEKLTIMMYCNSEIIQDNGRPCDAGQFKSWNT